MNLNQLLEQGIIKIMKTAGRFYLNNPQGRAFLADALPALKKQAQIRAQKEAQGLHIPAFLIASVASQCNLRCTGCYARAGGGCGAFPAKRDLDTEQWRSIFSQASGLGISFILLAGGEPLMRRDILELAAEFPQMIFPVFTNGTMLDGETIRLFDRHRNLIPVLSIEGGEEETDLRRGAGTYGKIEAAMEELKRRRILFGSSITVTGNNLYDVTESGFVDDLYRRGCGLVLYVEYVPAEEGTENLVLGEEEIADLQERCAALKKQFDKMIVLSFPGDEQVMGGCLASGRGFFHINPQGDAEPCPFSPYARQNLADASIAEVLQSEYFAGLRELAQGAEHQGGCTLFHKRMEVACLQTR